jgi:phosphosulfolactate phosphohydrolase-like enzyme
MRIVLVPTAQALSVRTPLPPGPAAVIDVLRATTTVVAAIEAGALAVEPVATVAAARRRAGRDRADGGEQSDLPGSSRLP